jgi:hypothetical protein
VFGGKPVEPVFPKTGNDPVADLRRVGALQGGAADTAWRDGRQPGFHPLGDCEGLGCARQLAGLAASFQVLDLSFALSWLFLPGL